MLTPKKRKFIAEFAKDGNGTQAAIRAGYSPASAYSQACRLLKDADVRRLVTGAEAAALERAGISAARVREEIGRIAFADVRKLFDEHGNLIPINELDEDAARSVAGIEVTRERVVRGDDVTTTESVTKVRSWDKPKALELLARHLGMLSDKVEHTGEIALATKVVHVHEAALGRLAS